MTESFAHEQDYIEHTEPTLVLAKLATEQVAQIIDLNRPMEELERLPAHPNAVSFLASITKQELTQVPELNQLQALNFVERLINIHDAVVSVTSQHPSRRGEELHLYVRGATTKEIVENMGLSSMQAVYVKRNLFLKVVRERGGISARQIAIALQEFAVKPDTDLDELLPMPIIEKAPRTRRPKPETKLRPVGSPRSAMKVVSEAAQSAAHEEELEEEVDADWDADALALDTVGQYLREIGRVKLLNAEQEVDLAMRIESGLMAEHFIKNPDELEKLMQRWTSEGKPGLADAEALRADLDTLAADGLRARDHLLKANLRLAVSLAKRQLHKVESLKFLDLIQIANTGLIRAVDKFDYTKGYKFSTYATWWIRQALQRGIADQERLIRVPVHMVEQINKALRIKRDYESEHGREPTNEELAATMGITTDRLLEILDYGRKPVSLDMPVGESDPGSGQAEGRFGDYIQDTDAIPAVDIVHFGKLQEAIQAVLNTMPERDKEVIMLRFGLQDGTPYTLDDIGKKLGLTRERIRQIESSTLTKLRHPSRAQRLKDYLQEL